MPDAPSPDLSIIIVSWNVRELLRGCLRSICRDQGSGVRGQGQATPPLTPDACLLTPEIIVIDNASADGSAAMVAAEFPQVRLIANADNRGFTGGNNQGIAVAQGRYVFFLNPDTVVMDDALATMIAYMEAHPDVGVIGPQLRYGDGSLQSSRRRFPTFGSALFESTPLAWHWPDNPWARRYRMEDRGSGIRDQETGGREQDEVGADSAGLAGEEVDWLVGAALLTRRNVIDQVGVFDEGYFMYSEELDWCRRVKMAGWRVVYLPSAQIVHYEGKSSEQVVAARHIHFHTSRVRYARKYHGAAAAAAVRAFLLVTFAFQWVEEGVKWLVGWVVPSQRAKRAMRRERMTAYRQVLRSRLR